jgi:hypothetical protein
MLMFKNEDFTGAAKGQEFTVLKAEPREGLVYVSFCKADGSLIAGEAARSRARASPGERLE